MQVDNKHENRLDFIKTLEIRDVILLQSEHKINELYVRSDSLHVVLTHNGENKINIKEKFIIFEISLVVKIFESESSEKVLLESSADFAAIYTYEDIEKFAENVEEFAVDFFRFSAVTHMMAFARKHFYDMINNSGYPRLFIPLVKSALDEDAEQAASTHLGKEKE